MATGTGPDSPARCAVPSTWWCRAWTTARRSYGPEAFAHTWAFLTGTPPATLVDRAGAQLRLDGKVSGFGIDNRKGFDPTNLLLAGARVEVFATHPDTGERLGPAVHSAPSGPTASWGPMHARPGQPYEFVVTADGYPRDARVPLAVRAFLRTHPPARRTAAEAGRHTAAVARHASAARAASSTASATA